jgi:hypothetical protein
MAEYFPFELADDNEAFSISVEIESPELFSKYQPLFERYGYSGNGYSWEGHIIQILENIDPELLETIEFDPEAGAFFASADTKENQIRFAELLSPIFSDMTELEGYIKNADRSRIDD